MYNYCPKNDDYKLILYYFVLQCVRVPSTRPSVLPTSRESGRARVSNCYFFLFIFLPVITILCYTHQTVQDKRHDIERDKDKNMIKIMHMVQYYNNYSYRVLKTNTLAQTAAHCTYVENAKMESSRIVRTSPALCVNNNISIIIIISHDVQWRTTQ